MAGPLGRAIKAVEGGIKSSKAIGLQKFSFGKLGTSVALFSGLNMAMGERPSDAISSGAKDAFLWEVLGTKMMTAVMAAQLLPEAVKGIDNLDRSLRSKYNTARRPSPTFSYKDTQQALTMRQAAVQAIQGSKLNARNALGGEASLMHRGWGGRT